MEALTHFPDHFSAGVPRETEEEKEFADFPIFDDPLNPFSSMNFVYEPIQFDRLTKLVEFNTLLCMDIIKEELEEVVARKKQFIPRLTLLDVVNTMRRVNSMRTSVKDNSDLKLKVSARNELELKRMSSLPDSEASEDSDGDYADALESIPDETTTL